MVSQQSCFSVVDSNLVEFLVVRQVYWQVADTRRRASDRLVSSRSTQLGKEDFYVVVIVPVCRRQ